MALPFFNKKNVPKDEIGTIVLPEQLPQHVGFIMDGNGRWATKRGMPRKFGHREGAKNFKDLSLYCRDIGLRNASFYVFSTENWKRSQEEVSTLMGILRWYLKDCVKKSMKNNVRCRVIGRKEELSPDIVQSIENLEEKTKNNTGLNFTIAINYGGRDEITRAVKKIAADVKAGKINPDDITEQTITDLSLIHI